MKKLLSLLCAFALILGLAAPALAVEYGAELNPNEKTHTQRFSDVPTNHWAFQYVGELVERGAINGYPDGRFYPDKTVTREEFAKIMVVAAGLTAAPATSSSYTDVDVTYWASPFIETAKPYMTAYQTAGGLVFRPKDGALREDIAVAVVKLKGYDTRLADLSIIQTMFSDVEAISAAAQPYVALAVENGIISGYTDGTFRGQATITRSEAAAMLWRAFQYGNDNKVIADETTPAPKPSDKPGASAAPTVSEKPVPVPSAKPETAKPFVAETAVKNVTISDAHRMMTMDDNSNLIFYNAKAGKIVSLDPSTDKTTTLLDVSRATIEASLENETWDDFSGSDFDTFPEDETGEAPGMEAPSTVTYEDLTVKQVFWDDVAHRLLVVGRFASVKTGNNDGWTLPGEVESLAGVFVLRNGALTYLADWPSGFYNKYGYSWYDLEYIQCALNDGSFIVSVNGGYNYSFIFDMEQGEVIGDEVASVGGSYFNHVFQNGSHIYSLCVNGYNNPLSRYNYGTGQTDEVTEIKGSALRYANNIIYSWSYDQIEAVRPADGATQAKLDPTKDVEIKDLRPLPSSPNNLFVTADEQYLFYDNSSNAIRVIRPNPNA